MGSAARAEATWTFPADATSVPEARHRVADELERWGLDEDDVDAGLLVATELVTNAVEHGTGPLDVHVRPSQDCLCIEVTTAMSTDRPRLLDPSPGTSTGRGLRVVEALSRSWGHTDQDERLTVWALVC